MSEKRKVVLAFSGGLDTSFCVKYLSEDRDLEVHSVIVNTGGFSAEELTEIEKKAFALGVKSHRAMDETQTFYQKCLRYLVFGNVKRNNTYPLSVSAERLFQALAVVRHAKEIGADCIAHGSTGAGNDQVRFDLVFRIASPDIEIITPIRDMKLSRQAEIDYLKKKGVEADWSKAKYSINKGIWGTSVGGEETLTSEQALPEEAYPTQATETEGRDIELTFERGELTGLDGKTFDKKTDAIEALQAVAEKYAIGRDIHVGDTIIGIKGRVGFEAAAPIVILQAHHALEKHTLTKWQMYWKEQLANWYGMLLHEGQYLDPVMRNVETFLEDSQKNVTGSVFVRLEPYRFSVSGIKSDHDLMSAKFGSYGEMNNAWTGEDVRGFTKILSNQAQIYYSVNPDESIFN